MGQLLIKRGGDEAGKANVESFDIWARVDSRTGKMDGPYPTNDTLVLHKELPARHPWHGMRLLTAYSYRGIGETRGPGIKAWFWVFVTGGVTMKVIEAVLYLLDDSKW